DVERELIGDRRAVAAVRQRVAVLAPRAARRDDLGVGELDRARAVRRDRIDPELEPAAALPVEQRRIAPPALDPDDLLARVDGDLRRGLVDHAAPDLGAALLVDERAVD